MKYILPYEDSQQQDVNDLIARLEKTGIPKGKLKKTKNELEIDMEGTALSIKLTVDENQLEGDGLYYDKTLLVTKAAYTSASSATERPSRVEALDVVTFYPGNYSQLPEALPPLTAEAAMIDRASTQLQQMVLAVKNIKRSYPGDPQKYNLLDTLKSNIEKAQCDTVDEVSAAAKNLLMLSLTRNKFGLGRETESGNKIKDLLNTPTYYDLRKCLFPKKEAGSSITYNDLVECMGVAKKGFFSSRKKEAVYQLFVNHQNKLLTQDEMQEFVASKSPVRRK